MAQSKVLDETRPGAPLGLRASEPNQTPSAGRIGRTYHEDAVKLH
jgi:hypothetical protein